MKAERLEQKVIKLYSKYIKYLDKHNFILSFVYKIRYKTALFRFIKYMLSHSEED